jgi:splicing factor 3A subunit 2
MSGREGFGSKPGSGGVATNDYADRRERLRQLALQTIDLGKDPYFMKNHLGSYECKLCLTLHNNEGSYLAHTQGKRHQTNVKRRSAKDSKELEAIRPITSVLQIKRPIVKRVKIGRPGYKVIKQHDPETNVHSLLFEIDYPDISEGIQPRHRFMSAFEQKVDLPADKRYMYLLFAADPYETIAFKIPNWEIERDVDKVNTTWDKEKRTFSLGLSFKAPSKGEGEGGEGTTEEKVEEGEEVTIAAED